MQEPTRPDTVPTYILDGVDRQDIETLETLQTYIDARIEYLQRDLETDALVDADEELVDVEDSGSVTTVIKKVSCGKDACSSCPHGPYVYSVTRDGDSLSWEYEGKATG